jgi:hypothetical protein
MGRIAVEGGERARRLFRDILVASASIPGVFPPALVRVSESGHEFDEMHVDGGTTSPFFIAPESGPLSAEELRALEGATVYVIVNGQLGGSTVTTPVRTVSIFRRGLDAALESSSRAAVEEALTTSNQAGMTLRVSEIPDDYPIASWLDMGRANMGALFDFGLRCATQNGLWDSAAHALARAKQSDFLPPSEPASCPAPAVVAVASVSAVSPP